MEAGVAMIQGNKQLAMSRGLEAIQHLLTKPVRDPNVCWREMRNGRQTERDGVRVCATVARESNKSHTPSSLTTQL